MYMYFCRVLCVPTTSPECFSNDFLVYFALSMYACRPRSSECVVVTSSLLIWNTVLFYKLSGNFDPQLLKSQFRTRLCLVCQMLRILNGYSNFGCNLAPKVCVFAGVGVL